MTTSSRSEVALTTRSASATSGGQLPRRENIRACGSATRKAAADLVVHATPVKDELLFGPQPGQTIVDLAYLPDGRDTAHVAAAHAAGCRVVDGLEVLARQGAASFERWTGIPAPLDVMRAAIRP